MRFFLDSQGVPTALGRRFLNDLLQLFLADPSPPAPLPEGEGWQNVPFSPREKG